MRCTIMTYLAVAAVGLLGEQGSSRVTAPTPGVGSPPLRRVFPMTGIRLIRRVR